MYFHHPRYSSGKHGSNTNMDPIWDLFVRGGGDIALSGHDHSYERFAPMGTDSRASTTGVRQFVVGTGGASYYSFGTVKANSQVRKTNLTAVLKVTVSGTTYRWRLVRIDGTVIDSGSGSCH